MGRTTPPVGPRTRRAESAILPPPFAAFRVVAAQAESACYALGFTCRFHRMLHRVENARGVFGSTETHSRGTSVPHLRLQLLEEALDEDELAGFKTGGPQHRPIISKCPSRLLLRHYAGFSLPARTGRGVDSRCRLVSTMGSGAAGSARSLGARQPLFCLLYERAVRRIAVGPEPEHPSIMCRGFRWSADAFEDSCTSEMSWRDIDLIEQ